MPAPSNPPPSNEGGAIIQPRELLRWLDVNIVHRLTRTQSYITLPVFSVASQWKGYSEIVATFPLVCTKNFSLKPFTAPLNPNYCLCIMWVDDEYNVYRYKLWGDVGEVFYFDVPDYENQPIHGNCRFEIWNTPPPELGGYITGFTLYGCSDAPVNGHYVNAGVNTWVGPTVGCIKSASSYNITYTTQIYKRTDQVSPGGSPVGQWIKFVGAGTPPVCFVDATYSQATALTFYTSALGGYDYRFQGDFSLAPTSTIVIDFSVALPANLPITFPAGSYPVLN